VACKPRILEAPDEHQNIANDPKDEDFIDMDLFAQIKELILCPVCYDVMKDPLNVKMCLHKFCSNCIENYARNV
jgi:hypothetical protein